MKKTQLPDMLYRAAQVRHFDQVLIAGHGIPGYELMQAAARAGQDAVNYYWPEAKAVVVVCGIGNNGGDGYVLARLLQQQGRDVMVLQPGDVAQVRGDALRALQDWHASGGQSQAFSGAQQLEHAGLIVDAMFGTGLARDVGGQWRQVIESINAAPAPVLALDIPSGLCADTGAVLGAAVTADVTVSFIALKQGMLTASGPDVCGELLFDDLGATEDVYATEPSQVRRMVPGECGLTRRRASTHKGQCGHVLLVGGNHGMSGAVRLAAEAAGRSGAGLVSVATRAGHAPMISVACPEVMSHAVESDADLGRLLQRASVVAIGPGLGQDRWARMLLAAVLETGLPLVIDADGLNLLAHEPMHRDDWILTPHPGEAARLLKSDSVSVQRDRFAAVSAIQQAYGGTCVLKGPGTLVDSGQPPLALCDRGNPGMASGGMGDVLTGVIAGLLAQGQSLPDAACKGAWVHAVAADRAAEAGGMRGLLAHDLMPELRRLVNIDEPGTSDEQCS
jgi:NAD(P)H-hydrate epimerase